MYQHLYVFNTWHVYISLRLHHLLFRSYSSLPSIFYLGVSGSTQPVVIRSVSKPTWRGRRYHHDITICKNSFWELRAVSQPITIFKAQKLLAGSFG